MPVPLNIDDTDIPYIEDDSSDIIQQLLHHHHPPLHSQVVSLVNAPQSGNVSGVGRGRSGSGDSNITGLVRQSGSATPASSHGSPMSKYTP